MNQQGTMHYGRIDAHDIRAVNEGHLVSVYLFVRLFGLGNLHAKNNISRIARSILMILSCVIYLKQLLGMTSIFVFIFAVKKCIPQIIILFFSELLDFFKYFSINISIKPLKTQTKFLYA